jgi:hypothetical protein
MGKREELSSWAKRQENKMNEKAIKDQQKKDGKTSYSGWVEDQRAKHKR